MTTKRTFRAAEVLSKSVIVIVQDALDESVDDFRGGYVYIPSKRGGDVRSLPKEERAFFRALSIIAVHDGFTLQEASTMAGVSIPTVNSWIKRFSTQVVSALNEVRKDAQ